MIKDSVWNPLKDTEVMSILDGDRSFDILELSNQLVDAKMKYLSGPQIVEIANKLGANISYLDEKGFAKSRWMYFEDLIDYCIVSDKTNELMNELFSKKNFRKGINDIVDQENLLIPEFSKVIPKWQRIVLNKINNILYTYDTKLVYQNGKWVMISLDDTELNISLTSKEDNSVVKEVVNMHDGFYILPFQALEEDMMTAINDELKNRKVDFKLHKSGDIFTDGDILKGILTDIKKAPVLVADISEKNPNVFYELGIANAWNKEVIMICSEKSKKTDYLDKYPFDIAGKMILNYGEGYSKMKRVASIVVDRIQSILSKQNS